MHGSFIHLQPMATDTNIRKTIAELEKDGTADFPLDRYDYVLACRTRLQTRYPGKKWASKKSEDVVTITRIL